MASSMAENPATSRLPPSSASTAAASAGSEKRPLSGW
jgi:hypothetical protein